MEKDEEEEEINAIFRKPRSRSRSATSIPSNLSMTKLKNKSTVTVLVKQNIPQEVVLNHAEITPIIFHENILNALTAEEKDREDGNEKIETKLFTSLDENKADLDQINTLEEEIH